MVGHGRRPSLAPLGLPGGDRSPFSARRLQWRTRRQAQLHGRTWATQLPRGSSVKLHAAYSDSADAPRGIPGAPRKLGKPSRSARGRLRLATPDDDFSERLDGSLRSVGQQLIVRGVNCHAAQELASTLPARYRAENAGRPVEAGVACRSLGIICYSPADFLNARNPLRTGARGVPAMDVIWRRGSGSATGHWRGRNVRPCDNELAIGRGPTRERTRSDMAQNHRGRRGTRPRHAYEGPSAAIGNQFLATILRARCRSCLDHGEGSGGSLRESTGWASGAPSPRMVVGWAVATVASPTPQPRRCRNATRRWGS